MISLPSLPVTTNVENRVVVMPLEVGGGVEDGEGVIDREVGAEENALEDESADCEGGALDEEEESDEEPLDDGGADEESDEELLSSLDADDAELALENGVVDLHTLL